MVDWTRDELVLAVALYLKEGEDASREARHELSATLRRLRPDLATDLEYRSPTAVKHKLMNLAAADPNAPAKSRLAKGGQLDGKVLAEFAEDPDALKTEVARIMGDGGLTAAPTDFERRLSEAVDPIYEAGGTSYRWRPVEDLVTNELHLPAGDYPKTNRWKRASKTSRIGNAYTESGTAAAARATVLFIVLGPAVSVDFARPRIQALMAEWGASRSQAVCLVVKDDFWRVQAILALERGPILDVLTEAFPAAAGDVTVINEGTHDPVRPPTDEFLHGCFKSFLNYADDCGFQVDASMALDLLAVTLSTQFIMFAGPSGTGKSFSARILMDFFAPIGKRATIETRRHWIGPEDVVGYYSPISSTYLRTPDTDRLLDLDISSSPKATTPFLLVEEMNLAPVEGYLAPLIHGLSGLSAKHIAWSLTAPDRSEDDEAFPDSVVLGPHLRLLGTINVDASAQAPAKKVAARAAVVLVEPVPVGTPEQIRTSLTRPAATRGHADPEFGDAAQDPLSIVAVVPEQRWNGAVTALMSLLALLPGTGPVSHRDLHRSLLYMLWYRGLASGYAEEVGEPELFRIAAENALLHFVLPGLAGREFREAVQSLIGAGTLRSATAAGISGLVLPRLERLGNALTEAGGFGLGVDFWTALT